MKFTCLSANPNSPCSVLKWKSLYIMLDCAMDQMTAMSYLPLPVVHSNHFASLPSFHVSKANQDQTLENELKENAGQCFVDSVPEFSIPDFSMFAHDLKEIDVILISNYRTMLALPYITERTRFSGLIFATGPTIKFGEMFMEELVTSIERNPKLKHANVWKSAYKTLQMPFPGDCSEPSLWQSIYTREEVRSCIAKIRQCTFTETNDIYGLLTVTPVCSGYLLGSCNWVIESVNQKVSYISASSSIRTHPKTMKQEPMENSDVVIINSLASKQNEDLNINGQEFVSHIRNCVSAGGNVLIPCYASGSIYEQIEFVVKQLDASGLAAVPIYLVSSIVESSLAYANVAGEWLREDYMARVYAMEEPFNHGQYLKNSRIRIFKSIADPAFNEDFRQPCVLFTGHPSLRFGDVVHFMELWGQNQKNLLILTDTDFPTYQALAPYQPLLMKVINCSFQTSLSILQANRVLNDLKPKNIVLSEKYILDYVKQHDPIAANERPSVEICIENSAKLFPYKVGETIKLPIKPAMERISLHEDLARKIVPFQSDQGVDLASVNGLFYATDNQYRLVDVPDESSPKRQI